MSFLDVATINDRHKSRFGEAVAALEEGETLTFNQVSLLNEATRQEWIEFYGGSAATHEKRVVAAAEVARVLSQKAGATMTPAEIAEAAGVSEGSVYNYLSDNPSATHKIGRGRYLVRDVAFERAEAGRPTTTNRPAQAVTSPITPPATAAPVEPRVAEVERALSAFTGHPVATAAPFTGKVPPP